MYMFLEVKTLSKIAFLLRFNLKRYVGLKCLTKFTSYELFLIKVQKTVKLGFHSYDENLSSNQYSTSSIEIITLGHFRIC